jgi:uncharacterized coiled-coil DUF342 family protein
MAQIQETVENLDDSIVSLRIRRNQLDDQAKNLAKKRDELNSHFQKLREQIQELKKKRDSFNQQVRELKEKREEARKKLVDKRGETDSIRKIVLNLEKRASGSYLELRKKMDDLEWRIQTNALSPKEEARLIGQIKGFESRVVIHEKIRELKDKAIMLQAGMGAARLKANEAHGKMSELVKESELYHEKMLEAVKQASEIKSKADEIHREYVLLKKEADAAHIEYVKAKESRQRMVMEDQMKRLKKEQEVKHKIESAAEEKLKRGEKLSLDEFRTLVEKGLV